MKCTFLKNATQVWQRLDIVRVSYDHPSYRFARVCKPGVITLLDRGRLDKKSSRFNGEMDRGTSCQKSHVDLASSPICQYDNQNRIDNEIVLTNE